VFDSRFSNIVLWPQFASSARNARKPHERSARGCRARFGPIRCSASCPSCRISSVTDWAQIPNSELTSAPKSGSVPSTAAS